jgi:glycosyltransferase involved in cell wall biosynthesis
MNNLILVNFSNQLAAGPKNIALNFIKQALRENLGVRFCFLLPDIGCYKGFSDTEKVKFIYVEKGNGLLGKVTKTVKINFFLVPMLAKSMNAVSVLAFGNFLLARLGPRKKAVLLHHPYIVDDELFDNLPISRRLPELIKRIAFRFTVMNVDKVVVQSEYMMREFAKKYPSHTNKLELIFNPISEVFFGQRSENDSIHKLNALEEGKKHTVAYISRFYPHKNHAFLINLAKKTAQAGLPIQFIITVDNNLPGAAEYLESVKKENLPIQNIGEINQSELIEFYKKSDLVIFPSKSETFGNPLIEGMFFSIPIIAPDKDYSRSILGKAGLFYKEDSADDCMSLLISLLSDRSKYLSYSQASYERSFAFPDSKEWFNQYLSLVEDYNEKL